MVLIDNNDTYATIEPSPLIQDNDADNTDNGDGKNIMHLKKIL